MKRVLAVVLAFIMIVGTALSLASCSDNGEGQTIDVFYVDSLYDFDPSLAVVDDNAMKVFGLVYEPLFTLTEKGKVKGALVDDYEYNEEENTLSLELRETYWSDGEPIDADDLLYAWQRILDPNTPNPAANLLYDIKNAVAVKRGEYDNGEIASLYDLGLKVEGSNVLVITFENEDVDYKAFLRNLTNVALTALRQDVIDIRDEYWSKRKATVVTSGPFMFGFIDYDSGYFTVTRNKYYNRPKGSKSDVDKYITPYTLQSIWNLWGETGASSYANMNVNADNYAEYLDEYLKKFEEGTVFYVGDLSLEARKKYNSDEELKKLLTVNDSPSTYSYIMNCDKFPASVRNAMSSVIDRTEIINTITFGHPATGLIGTTVYNGDAYKDGYFRDAEGADLISTTVSDDAISAAKTAVNNAAKNGTFDKTAEYILKIKNSEEDIAVAQYAIKQWAKIGITVKARIISYTKAEREIIFNKDGTYDCVEIRLDDLQNSYTSGDYDIIAIDYQMLSVDAFSALAAFSTNYNGFGADFSMKDGQSQFAIKKHSSGYASDAYDALIDAAYNEKNLDERVKILHEAEELLLSESPIIPVYFNQNFYIKSKDFKKVDNTLYGIPVFNKSKVKGLEPIEENTEDK